MTSRTGVYKGRRTKGLNVNLFIPIYLWTCEHIIHLKSKINILKYPYQASVIQSLTPSSPSSLFPSLLVPSLVSLCCLASTEILPQPGPFQMVMYLAFYFACALVFLFLITLGSTISRAALKAAQFHPCTLHGPYSQEFSLLLMKKSLKTVAIHRRWSIEDAMILEKNFMYLLRNWVLLWQYSLSWNTQQNKTIIFSFYVLRITGEPSTLILRHTSLC